MNQTHWQLRFLVGRVGVFGTLLFLALPVFAQADVFLPPIGGGGGGGFTARCDSPEYLIGFQLRTGDDVDAIRPLCARIYGGTAIGPVDSFRVYFGGDGGAERDLVCPPGKPIVIGMEIGYEGEDTIIVNNVHLFCGVASSHQVPTEEPSAVFDGPPYRPNRNIIYSGKFSVASKGKQACPAGYLALGIQGRSGVWLDAVGLVCGVPKFSRNPNGTSTPEVITTRQGVKTLGRVPVTEVPAYIYAVTNDAAGSLKWFRHDGASTGKFNWQGPRVVNAGWSDFKQVFPGGDGRIYAITRCDTLMLYQHTGFGTGLSRDEPGVWLPAQQIATGWSDVTYAFSGGEGVIYTITSDGSLNWYRHTGGATLVGPRKVGRGWSNLKQVVSIGGGVIYAITLDGKIKWFRHNGYLTGEGLENPGAWIGPKEVGSGWGIYQRVFATANGVFYGVASDGKLMWYHHRDYRDGSMNWDGPLQVGTGWGDLLQVFAQP